MKKGQRVARRYEQDGEQGTVIETGPNTLVWVMWDIEEHEKGAPFHVLFHDSIEDVADLKAIQSGEAK